MQIEQRERSAQVQDHAALIYTAYISNDFVGCASLKLKWHRHIQTQLFSYSFFLHAMSHIS